jgi:hypothetical protein
MEVSKADFARMAGVSKAAISKKSKNKRLIVNSAGLLDTDNPINRMYLEKHQKELNKMPGVIPGISAGAPVAPAEPTAPAAVLPVPSAPGAAIPGQPAETTTAAAPARRTYKDSTGPKLEYAADANKMLNMTLRELLQNYNGLDGIEKYAKILKDLMAADERAQRIQERRQLQIPKDFVISRLFGYINQQNNRLLDLPESMADQLIALAQTGTATPQTGATVPQANTALSQSEQEKSQSVEQLADAALSLEPVSLTDTPEAQNPPIPNTGIAPETEIRVSLNDTRQKIVNYLSDNITRCIGGAKQAVISELKTLQTKYTDNDDTQNQLQDIYEALNEN